MISVDFLKSRAKYLKLVRDFFFDKDILEVDCPILSYGAAIDEHIDLFETECLGKKYYLHSSPEYGMKRLLANGAPDIYQVSHVFRRGESGPKHNPEFTLIEWYRLGFSIDQMIDETLELLNLFLGQGLIQSYSYKQAFETFLQLDLDTITKNDLLSLLGDNLSDEVKALSFETLLPFVFSECIEKKFAPDQYTVIYDFPKDQAALAKVENGQAKRFEIFFGGYELANGYLENQSSKEQRERFDKVLQEKKDLQIDEPFLKALDQLPDCSGVAVGFDRLLMLALKQDKIASVIPISWDES